jgi:hypothetical protein
VILEGTDAKLEAAQMGSGCGDLKRDGRASRKCCRKKTTDRLSSFGPQARGLQVVPYFLSEEKIAVNKQDVREQLDLFHADGMLEHNHLGPKMPSPCKLVNR